MAQMENAFEDIPAEWDELEVIDGNYFYDIRLASSKGW